MGVENNTLATSSVDALCSLSGEAINVHIARGHHAPGGGNADLVLLEVLALESYGMQHGAASGALHAIDDG